MVLMVLISSDFLLSWCRRPCFSGRCCPCLERTIPRHVKSEPSLRVFCNRPKTHIFSRSFPDFRSACEVTCIIIGHFNCLLTYLRQSMIYIGLLPGRQHFTLMSLQQWLSCSPTDCRMSGPDGEGCISQTPYYYSLYMQLNRRHRTTPQYTRRTRHEPRNPVCCKMSTRFLVRLTITIAAVALWTKTPKASIGTYTRCGRSVARAVREGGSRRERKERERESRLFRCRQIFHQPLSDTRWTIHYGSVPTNIISDHATRRVDAPSRT